MTILGSHWFKKKQIRNFWRECCSWQMSRKQMKKYENVGKMMVGQGMLIEKLM